MIDGEYWNGHITSVSVIYASFSYMDYDWTHIAIVRNDKGEYAMYSDSGCSCNWAYEKSPDEYDLAWTNDLMQVIREVRQAIRSDSWYTADRKAAEFSELSTLRYREGLK